MLDEQHTDMHLNEEEEFNEISKIGCTTNFKADSIIVNINNVYISVSM